MAPPVYTELFAEFALSGGVTFTATPPGTDRWIIHDIAGLVYNSGDLVAEVIIDVNGTPFCYRKYPPVSNRSVHWRGQQTVDPGADLNVTFNAQPTVGDRFYGRIVGAALSLP